MYSFERLQAMRSESQRALGTLRTDVTKLNDQVAGLKADKTRDPKWLNGEVDRFRQEAMRPIGEQAAALQAKADDAAAQRKFWASRALVMARRRFHADAGTDAAIRAATIADLSLMTTPLLQLAADAALAEGDMARLSIALRLGEMRGEPAWKGVNFDAIDLPEQRGSLAAIAAIEADAAEAQLLVAQALGRAISPVDKMTIVRMRTAAPVVPPIEEGHHEATEQTAIDTPA